MDDIVSNNPGEGGVGHNLLLRRSELAALRALADRYPATEGERREVVDWVMKTLRGGTPRLQMSAAMTMAKLDGINLQELGLYLRAKELTKQEQPTTVHNTQINFEGASLDDLRRLRDAARRVRGPDA